MREWCVVGVGNGECWGGVSCMKKYMVVIRGWG